MPSMANDQPGHHLNGDQGVTCNAILFLYPHRWLWDMDAMSCICQKIYGVGNGNFSGAVFCLAQPIGGVLVTLYLNNFLFDDCCFVQSVTSQGTGLSVSGSDHLSHQLQHFIGTLRQSTKLSSISRPKCRMSLSFSSIMSGIAL